jgi:hypothetical protein
MSSKAKAATTAQTAESNVTAKLALVIKSGKFKIGKYNSIIFILYISNFQIKFP